ncbi:MAG: sulfatase-like hydrolase/transferase [Bacteroidales bacterium]|nr:sulfatase-like hydrolase/transferase [Bacteroidales bacterium]
MNILIKILFTGAVLCCSAFQSSIPEQFTQPGSPDSRKNSGLKRPNILLIMTDQHNAEYLHCLGKTFLNTPNLDALAKQSVIFRSAYSPSPGCGPSRAAVFTGQYPFQNGVFTNWVPVKRSSILLTEQLKRGGYYNIAVGKLYLAPVDSSHGFDYRKICDSPHDLYNKKEVETNDYLPWAAGGMGIGVDKLVEKAGESERSAVDDTFFWLGKQWADEKYHMTTWTGNESVSVIKNYAEDKPFFMHVSFFGPHHPYSTCEPWNSMYDPKEVPLPYTLGQVQAGAQKGFHTNWTESQWREIIARYSGNISAIDFQVGRIIAELKEKGLWENTIVVFTSDHGDHMGDYSQIGKGTMLESSVRVPFFIKPTGTGLATKECTDVISLIDLYSTFLDYAGVKNTAPNDSRSLRGLLTGETTWQDKTFSSMCSADGRNGQVMYIDKNFKCVGFLTDGILKVELYDRNEPVADQHNLADNYAYADIRNNMKDKLEEWLRVNLKN